MEAALARLTWADVGFGIGIFAGTLVLNALVLGAVILRLPATYLADHHVDRRGLGKRIVANLLGLVLIAIGIVTSLPGVPGQGLLTIAVGIVLMDVPGKRRVARALLRRGHLLERVNAFRRRFGMAPLVLACDAPS